MKRKIIALFLISLFLFSVISPMTLHAQDYQNEDSLTSTNVAVFNTDKGFLVYGKSEHEKIAPGSSTKIMTAILALEYFEGRLDTVLTVTAGALRGLEGSAVLSLKADEQITVIDLIHATLVAGMNDAANVLAIAIGGSIASERLSARWCAFNSLHSANQ